jgi:hypothetical protein
MRNYGRSSAVWAICQLSQGIAGIGQMVFLIYRIQNEAETAIRKSSSIENFTEETCLAFICGMEFILIVVMEQFRPVNCKQRNNEG